MRSIFRVQILRSAVFAAVVVAGAFLLNTSAVSAHDGHDESADASYTAQAGDSQTIFARDAINHYASENDVKLSDEQRIYAETNLVKKMGDRYLEIGEEVTIKQADIKSVVDNAGGLNEEAKAAWSPYAATVDYSSDTLNAAISEEQTSSSDTASSSDSKDEARKDGDKKEEDKKDEDKDESSSPWYSNVFTWILIIAAAVVLWSLFASRKDEK